jgi:hypothetical protein
MNGDISRITFDPLKHFTSVLLQQGRVQMDADGNEQAAILLHYLRSLAADLIGQHGGPDDVFQNPTARTGLIKRNCGFAIIAAKKGTDEVFPKDALNDDEKKKLKETPDKVPLLITKGHYYVDGLLCENDSYPGYWQQPDMARANDDEISKLANGIYLFYIDVWERIITSLEEPSIREVALCGADTAARTKLTWQVRVGPTFNAAPDCAGFESNTIWVELMYELKLANRGRLQARAKKGDTTGAGDPCTTSPEARYRGMENQLYRVEVHQGGPALDNAGSNQEDAATFKWSRDNGTVVAALKRKEGDRLIVSGLRDFSRWFTAGNWVEITHDALELNALPGTLVRLTRVEGETLTIDPYTTSGTVYEPTSKFAELQVTNLKVRRWDHKEPEDGLLKEGAIPIEEDVWIELEDGVEIRFKPGTPATKYRTGDYWLIPARVSTGDVEWPQTSVPDPNDPTKFLMGPKPLPPNGVEHHYAPLAAVTLAAGSVTDVVDLRHKFPPQGVCS